MEKAVHEQLGVLGCSLPLTSPLVRVGQGIYPTMACSVVPIGTLGALAPNTWRKRPTLTEATTPRGRAAEHDEDGVQRKAPPPVPVVQQAHRGTSKGVDTQMARLHTQKPSAAVANPALAAVTASGRPHLPPEELCSPHNMPAAEVHERAVAGSPDVRSLHKQGMMLQRLAQTNVDDISWAARDLHGFDATLETLHARRPEMDDTSQRTLPLTLVHDPMPQ
tara:strand:+ start:14 stop:676 length:663 start_codon:yes stop_codon:yes gene_type:complete